MTEKSDTTAKTAFRELSEALALCNDPNLVEEFLYSLFTPAEADDIGKRWALVKLLDEGHTQRRIASELHLSLCKITRGSKELKKDDSPFRKMINLIEAGGKD